MYVLSDTGAWLSSKRSRGGSRGGEVGSGGYDGRHGGGVNRGVQGDREGGTDRATDRGADRGTTDRGCNEAVSEHSVKVCDPFSADIHFTRRVVKGVPLASIIALNMGDVSASLSLPHISLARSILLRGSLSGLFPPKLEDLTYYCIFGDRKDDKGTQVDVYIIALNIGRISVTAVNGMQLHTAPRDGDSPLPTHNTWDTHQSTPLVRFQLLSLQFNADGVLNPKMFVNSRNIRFTMDVLNVEGTGEAAVGLDFFNPFVKHWEPLLEEWEVGLTVSKKDQEIMCTIGDMGISLQLNISGRFLDTMMETYAKWLRNESEKKALRLPRSSSRGGTPSFVLSSKGSDNTVGAGGMGGGGVRESGRLTGGEMRGRRTSSLASDLDLVDFNYDDTNISSSNSSSYPLLIEPQTDPTSGASQSGSGVTSPASCPFLVVHNRLLCDLHVKLTPLRGLPSPAAVPSRNFSSLFYSSNQGTLPGKCNKLVF